MRKFDPALRPHLDGTNVIQLGEVTMFIEAATSWPSADDEREQARLSLHNALDPHLFPNNSDRIEVQLRPQELDREIAALIYKTELIMQRWRWDGRPVYREEDEHREYGYPLIPAPDNQAIEPY